MKKTVYEIKNNSFGRDLCFALVSDLHGNDPTDVLKFLDEEAPDYILMPGDIFEKLDRSNGRLFENSLRLLNEASKIAPVFYSTGNHEDGAVRMWLKRRKSTSHMQRKYNKDALSKIKNSGVIMLEDSYVLKDGIVFGGLSSGLINPDRTPKLEWMDEFLDAPHPKVLLSHHPEYYKKYLKNKDIDLIVSGHAHGGQWRFFGRGVFAPGQGIFPKYTYGVHDGRFVISTGLERGDVPRFFNPIEVVFIKIKAV